MPSIRNIETDVIYTVSQNPVFVDGMWECGDQRFVDLDGTIYEPIITLVPPTVGPIAFMRLFTADERVKARELRATNPKINDFFLQLEDPRTDAVVMVLPSIQADIEYVLTAVEAAGLSIDVQARKSEILTGQPN